jgi:hypothetical protein
LDKKHFAVHTSEQKMPRGQGQYFGGVLFFLSWKKDTSAIFRICASIHSARKQLTMLLIDLASRMCHRQSQELLYATHLAGMVANTTPSRHESKHTYHRHDSKHNS